MNVLLIAMLVFFSLSCCHYLFTIIFFLRGVRMVRTESEPQGCTFSIVIAARNEEHTLGPCLESICAQTLSPRRYEVIVVDDRSEDGTRSIAGSFASRYPAISVVPVTETPKGVSPKKHALSRGIERSLKEIIVFTDADCRVPPTWLETMDRYFLPDTGCVQGITAYRKPPDMNHWLYGLQAVDFLSHGIVSAAGIGANLPINANANNFAFRREAYREVGGYGNVGTVISGDDDLMLQRLWRDGKWRLRYMIDRQGAVSTEPTRTIRGIFEQRKRWGSKTVHYHAPQIALLGGVFLFYLSCVAALALGFWYPVFFIAFGGMAALKLAGEYAVMIPGTRIFNQRELRRYILPASLLHLPLVIAAFLLGAFGRFEWKGRRYSRKA